MIIKRHFARELIRYGERETGELISESFYFHVEQLVHATKRPFGTAGAKSDGKENP